MFMVVATLRKKPILIMTEILPNYLRSAMNTILDSTKKMQCESSSVSFMGHRPTNKGVQPDPS